MILRVKDLAANLDEETTLGLSMSSTKYSWSKRDICHFNFIQPGDNDSREVEIVRDEIIVESVVLDFLKVKINYLPI
jgi:hypothetical protein